MEQDIPILEVKNLTLLQPNLFNNVNFSLYKGDFSIVLGGNGSGKTTFLKIVTGATYGLKIVDNYEIKYNGRLLKTTDDFQYFRREICFIEQKDDNDNFDYSTPYEEVFYSVANINSNINKKQLKEKVVNLFDYFQVKNIMHKKIKVLSGGQKRLVSIMAGLIRDDAKLFLIDEPINNLDTKNAILVSNYITNLHKRNPSSAIMLVTHCRMFPKVSKAYEIINKQIVKSEYKYQTCFGCANKDGLYEI